MTYSLSGDTLAIEYRATTDSATIVNISNHSYWNLSGEGSSAGATADLVTITAETFLPTDATSVPTGEFHAVEGTVLDFRTATPVGERVREAGDEQIVWARGHDQLGDRPRGDGRRAPDGAGQRPRLGPRVRFMVKPAGAATLLGQLPRRDHARKAGRLYRQGDALVLEPQLFPDTPDHPQFGSARLAPGEEYRNVIRYRFGTDG